MKTFTGGFATSSIPRSWIMLGWVLVTLSVVAVQQRIGAAETVYELPKEEVRLKSGEGVERVQASCLICHSTDYISTQPLLTKAQWTATVEKMRVRYGAPILTNNVAPLVEYLTKNYGKAASAPAAGK